MKVFHMVETSYATIQVELVILEKTNVLWKEEKTVDGMRLNVWVQHHRAYSSMHAFVFDIKIILLLKKRRWCSIMALSSVLLINLL